MLFAAAAAAEVDTVALLCLGSLAGAITACELAVVGCQAGSLSCVVVLGASHVHDF